MALAHARLRAAALASVAGCAKLRPSRVAYTSASSRDARLGRGVRGGESGGGAALDGGGGGVVAALFEEGGGNTGKSLAAQRADAYTRGIRLGVHANEPEAE